MRILLIILFFLNSIVSFSQSSNCATATQINLVAGSACVNGTNVNAVTDNILYGSCNAAPVNMVWYTYVANGSNNTFTVTPGTLTNAEIVIYQNGCPSTGALQTCTTATGSNSLITTWGMVAGDQVWVGIASNNGTDGTFQLCIKSTPPLPGAGNTCSQAIPICSMANFTKASVPNNASGVKPSCFGAAPQQDVWYQFTVSQSGSLGWEAIPNNAGSFFGATEFDWALWDITASCPTAAGVGSLVCCNYNYAGGSDNGFGMQNYAGNSTCNTNAFSNDIDLEFSPRVNIVCGRTYAIQISNYDNDNVGFSFSFVNSTCVIGTTSAFTLTTPTLVCGATLPTTINNTSTGTCNQVWDYGDGSATYTGGTPPAHTYTTPGTYAITAISSGACTSSATKFVKLLAPLNATVTPTDILCAGQCNGIAAVTQITGGDGVYTYSWNPTVSNANTINNLCAGDYTVNIGNATCATTITNIASIIAPTALTITATPFSPGCGASNGSITASLSGGTPNYSFSINGGAYSSSSTFTNLTAGSYTISGRDINACSLNTVVVITSVPTPTAAFTVTANCINSQINLNNTSSVVVPATLTLSSWSFGAGATPATSNATNPPSLNYNTSGIKTITLTITSSDGCSSTTTNTVDVFADPVASFSVNNSCLNIATNFTSTATPSASITLHEWDFGDGSVISNSVNPSHTYTVNGSYPVSYSVTSTSGCKSSITNTVTLNANPLVAVMSDTVCLNATTSFTNISSILLPDNITNLDWDFNNDGVVDDNTQNPTNTYTTSGTHTGELVATSNNGCKDSATFVVMINENPTASFTTTSACLGSTVGVINTSSLTPPATITTYAWNFGSGATVLTSSLSAPAGITYTTSGVKNILLALISSQTCTAIVTNTVEVFAPPVANFSTTSVCQSTATAFTDMSTATGSISIYSWDFTTDNISDNATSNPTHTYTASGTYSTTLIITDDKGCKDTLTQLVDVWGHSVPSFTANNVCFNSQTSFTNNTSVTTNSNTGTVSYSWNFGDLSAADITPNPTHTYTSSINGATFNATLTATTSNSCIDTYSTPVKIYALPTASFTTGNACVNSNIVLNNLSSITAPATISVTAWAFGSDATPLNSLTTNPASLTYSLSGIKTITLALVSAESCTALTTNTVNVFAQPVANFSATAVCQLTATAFTDMSTPLGSITSYSWDYTNNNSTDNITSSPTFVYPTSGTYTTSLIVRDNNGCKDTMLLPINVWGHAVPDFNTDKVCFGTTTSFTNLTSVTTNSNTGTVNYDWAFGDATANDPSITPTHNYALNGNNNATYQTTLTVTTINNCIDKIIKPVLVYSIPTASFTSIDKCQGIATPFSDVSNGNGNAITTYAWDFENNGNTDAVISTPSFIFNNYGVNNVSYTVTTSPVPGLVCANSTNTITAMVNPNPIPDFVFVANCINAQPNSFNATPSIIAIGTNTSYAWTFGDGGFGNGIVTTHTYNTAGTYTANLIVTSDKGCQSIVVKTIDVYQKPNLTVTPGTACAGLPLSFTTTPVFNSPNIQSYNWDFNNSPATIESTLQNPSYIFSQGGSYTVSLIAKTSNNCSETYNNVVKVNYLPKPNFTVSDPGGCGESFCTTFSDFTPAITGPELLNKWEWTFGDGTFTISATNNNQDHCFKNLSN